MAGLDMSGDGLIDVGFDARDPRYRELLRASWPSPMPMEQSISQPGQFRRTTTPLETSSQGFHQMNDSSALMGDWSFSQPSQIPFSQDATTFGTQITGTYGGPFQSSPIDFMPVTQAQIDASMGAFVPMSGPAETFHWNLDEVSNGLVDFTGDHSLSGNNLAHGSITASSPTDTNLELQSLPSSSSDNGWAEINFNSYPEAQIGAIFNPGETLHIRTGSDSSQSDIVLRQARNSFDSFEDISYPLTSPDSDIHTDLGYCFHPQASVSPSAAVEPVPIKSSVSPSRSASSQGVSSPPSRRASRKSPIAKATKPVIRRPSQPAKKDSEKRVGRRRGPLLPEQRKQASEIRKLRACLRCKFLKKTVCVSFQGAHRQR